jgi:ABC-type transporter Mla subunit MlaD
MSNDARKKFRIGILVLGSLILLALLIVLFGEFPNFLRGQVHYVVKLPQAPGVQEGTVVRKSGIRIGEVNSVELDPITGEVTLHVTVQKKYQLREGDAAVLGRGLVLGDSTLNFVPNPRQPGAPAPDGYTYRAEVSGDLNKALTEARELVPVIASTSEDIRRLTKSLQEVVPDIKKTAAEIQVAATSMGRTADTVDNLLRSNQDKITSAIDNISRVTARLGDLLTMENQERIARIIRNVENATASLDSLLGPENRNNLAIALKSIKETSDRMAKVLSEENQKNLSEIIQNLRLSSARITNVLNDENQKNFAAALQGIRLTTDQLTKFLSEDNQKNLSGTLQNLKTSSERLDGVLKNFDGAVTDARKTMKNVNDRVDRSGEQFEGLLTDARKTMKKVDDNVEIIGKDLQDAAREGKLAAKRFSDSAVRFDEAMTNLRDVAKMVSERGPNILKNLEAGTAQWGTISANLSDFTKALLQGDGTIRRLINDPALYNSLNDAARGLNGSFSRFERIAKDFEIFADKIARHPEILGLRGAVAPGSGIK